MKPTVKIEMAGSNRMTEEPVRMIPYFPRTPNAPLVSIMIPTRERPSQLERCINSFISRSDKRNYEFLLKVDDDDIATIDWCKNNQSKYPLRFFVSPQGEGYCHLHLFMNRLASMANGDWLWVIDDDVEILTDHWDSMIEGMWPGRGYVGQQEVGIYLMTGDSFSMPLLRRGVYKLWGRVSMDPAVDRWLYYASCMAGIASPIDIKIHHYRYEESVSKRIFYSGVRNREVVREQLIDCTKLIDYLEERDKKANWVSFPEEAGWYSWVLGNRDTSIFVYEGKVCRRNDTKDWDIMSPKAKWCKV